MKRFWVSTRMITGQVNIDSNGYIIFAPPIWHQFVGKQFKSLISCFKHPLVVQL